MYGVMQSDGNSFCEDVVLDSFNKASRNEDNILDQVYKSKYAWIFIMMILIRKFDKTTAVALKPNYMSSLLLRAVFLLICIFLNNSYSLNLHNKRTQNCRFHIFGLKCCLYLNMPC